MNTNTEELVVIATDAANERMCEIASESREQLVFLGHSLETCELIGDEGSAADWCRLWDVTDDESARRAGRKWVELTVSAWGDEEEEGFRKRAYDALIEEANG